MKVAFINGAYENLGVKYLSAVLKKHGHQTKLFVDPQLFDDSDVSVEWLNKILSFKEKVVKDAIDYKPDLLCFSVKSDFYGWACELAKMVKVKAPQIPIIFGGIHPTSAPEYVIQNESVDIVCIGEGEYALLELVESLKKGRIDYSIRNLWFKKQGKIIKNPLRPLIENLDELPFADKDLFYEASPAFKISHFTTMAGRGCSYSCTYCCNSFLKELYKDNGKYLRRRSVGNVIEELLKIKQSRKISRVWFSDDCFVSGKEWLEEFSEEYAKKIDIPFHCFVHPGHVNDDIVRLLKKAGCFEVEIGVQTWSEDIRRKVLNRYVSNTQIEKAIKTLKKYGLRVATDTMFGVPGQTIDEILELAKFYNRNRISLMHILFLRYYPKIKIIQASKDMGILTDEDIYVREAGVSRSSMTITRGGDAVNKQLLQLKMLFVFLPCLPRRLNTFLINKKAYRYFPPSLFAATLLNNLFGNVSAIGHSLRKTKIYLYIYYIAVKLKPNLNLSSSNNKQYHEITKK